MELTFLAPLLEFHILIRALLITFGMIANKLLVSGNAFMTLVIWVVCVIVAYVVVLIINHWLPWVWDLRHLNR